jgi:RNA polymerase sigma-70 factor (ECF subfamily)
MRDEALAEDALQELLATLLHRGESFREAESPYKWLCRAVDRTCLDLLRRQRRVREALTSDGLERLDPLGPAPGMDAEERLAALQSLGRLDEDQQALAIMLFVDGMSQGEAAEELGVSRVTVNKRAQAIRMRLGLRTSPAPSTEVTS